MLEMLSDFLYTLPMRHQLFMATLLCCLFLSTAYAEDVRFLHAIDGDSIQVVMNARTHEVRLIGIDAPEHGQEYSAQSRAALLKMCYGQSMRLEFDAERKDRYGRLLAYAYCGKGMVNEELVRAGLALAYPVKPNTRYASRLKKAEDAARSRRMGFWLRGGLKQTPQEWRRNQAP